MHIFGLTDVGLQRSENQDACAYEALDENRAIFVVCDGMGGAQAGNVASSIASDVFMEHMKRDIRPVMSDKYARSVLLNAINFANYEVYRKSVSDSAFAGMGTTLVGGFFQNGAGILANIGDSRAYYLGSSGISRITRDHSVVEEMLARGQITEEQARRHPRRNLITRALGTDERVRADYYPFSLAGDTALFLCSDGLSGMIDDQTIRSVFLAHPEPEVCAQTLIDAANTAGGHDNITVFMLRA
ncbi:MAG: Stp1/IreP family PP2C-type Ser/Thr phosphatase [Clostridiaceae bacterium]|nr:Stp1/IreP family PP2C-type Ser/Thr phosphatase [Clostridiaceae bacterium]MDY3072178.1 Stp1/IreP family PP2C-type Ser/Thr phosphatase [Eubacteriales bacterium]MDY5014751.1 Stp1/IreP family PP2C-type Ser/Thr phosphatase [Eubacteriales bacterium]